MTTRTSPPAKPVKAKKRPHHPRHHCLIGNVGHIDLGNGRMALCDRADFERLSKHLWTEHKSKAGVSYARCVLSHKPRRRIFMHTLLVGPGRDHKNGNGLDNRRSNLRDCTNAENARNKAKYEGTSRFKGAHWDKRKRQWSACIWTKGKSLWLGYFRDEEDAAIHYDVAAQIFFGPFARLNNTQAVDIIPRNP